MTAQKNRSGSYNEYASITDNASGGGNDYYPGTENFGTLTHNNFVYTEEDNLSTFGVDVDNGSYTFGRKKIK